MKITLKLNSYATIENAHNLQKGGKVQQFATQTCAKRNDKYVPFLTGKLKNTVEIGKTKYTYVQPYAKRQYFTNKGRGIRGAYWDKLMMSAEGSNIIKDIERFMR